MSRRGSAGLAVGLLVAVLTLLPGCAGSHQVCSRGDVFHDLSQRSGLGASLLPDFCLDGVLTEEAALVLALWNNAAFQEVLVDLQLTRADLVQAGLLPNPELWYLNPVGVKQLEYAIELPLDVLWLRPVRLAAARREQERTCQQLVQSGLDLMRHVRQAYYDTLLAQERLQVAEEAARLRQRIASLAEARFRAGDIGPPEAAAARIDALQAEQDLLRFRLEVQVAEETLRNWLGLGACRMPLILDATVPLPAADLDAEALACLALQNRPDLLAAQQAVQAAEERVRLARRSWFLFRGILDANGRGEKGFEIGPGFRVSLPVFNQGQGGIARAEAEREQAKRRQTTVHDRILLEVYQAQARYQQARAELDYLERRVRPEVETAIGRADRAYKEGQTTYLLVLEASRQLLDSHLRAAQLRADLRRAWAELERSVGCRLDTSTPAAPAKEATP